MKIQFLKDWKNPVGGKLHAKDSTLEVTNEIGWQLIDNKIAKGPLVRDLEKGKKGTGVTPRSAAPKADK